MQNNPADFDYIHILKKGAAAYAAAPFDFVLITIDRCIFGTAPVKYRKTP